MSTFYQCPTCGNTKRDARISRCKKCLTIFCDSCADKRLDHFPLPFSTTHCPRCGSTDIAGVGGIWD